MKVAKNNRSKKSKSRVNSNSTMKSKKSLRFCTDKYRNKDNIYFLQYYFQNELDNDNSRSIINEMFDCIELKYVQHKYNCTTKNEETDITTTRFTLDKNSCMVYENPKRNSVQLYGYYEKSVEMKDKKRKKWNRIDIYNKKQQHTYVVYPDHQEFEIIQDVFDEYKDIIEYEHDLFKCALDDEISTIVDDIKKVDDMDDKDASRALKMKLGKVINNLYNSNLDITEETYKTFNEFLSKFE